MQLPPTLAAALADLLEGVPRQALARAAQQISQDYRQGQTSQAIATPLQATAYALTRMPATFAACAAVFARIKEVMPHFAPSSLVDMGAGTGAASWAAATAWTSITSALLLDQNPALRALATRLGLANADIRAGTISQEVPKADLMVSSYVLVELTQDRAGPVAVDLWRSTKDVLCLIEPGTPAGFDRIRTARTALISTGAHILAPCTHDAACPMTANDWCHFSQRLSRSRDHMLLKDAQVPFEDERYCYVVATRQKIARGARILSPRLKTKPGLAFKLCDEKGLRVELVQARDKQRYRSLRKRGWGDLF